MAAGVQVLTFRVGGADLAAPVQDIRQVFRRGRITRVPHAPSSLAGVASLRGAVVPVVSLARLLGQEEASPGPASRIVLLGFDEPVALAVDQVGALDRLDPDVEQVAAASGLGRVYLRDQDTVRTVDLASLLARDFQPLDRARTGVRSAPPAARQGGHAAEEIALVIFGLADQTYGLPLTTVSEVMAAPPHILALPHTDAAMVGAISVRDAVVPIVSLRALLGLGAAPPSASGRIVIVSIGQSRIGLRVDHLQAILRISADRIEPTPTLLNRGAGEARIEAICRLPEGRGLVSILSPDRIFRDETWAQLIEDGRQKGVTMGEADAATQAKILVFRLGEEEYGLPLGDVNEVLRLPATLTRVPKAPAFVLGVMNLRGKLLPVIDQRDRFGTPGAPPPAGRRVIVTRLGDREAGFVVDGVSEILTLTADQLAPASALTAEAGRMFDRVAHLDVAGRIILVVDPQALLDRAERDLLTAFDQGSSPAPS